MALQRATRQVDAWAEEAGFETLIVDSATVLVTMLRSTLLISSSDHNVSE